MELRGFITDLGWSACQWSREVCISAAEMEWTDLPRDITDQVVAVSRVASTSKLADDAFNELRAQAEPARNTKQGPHAVWQACSSCTLCQDYDLDPVEVAPANEVELSDVPQSLFYAKKREEQMSLPEAKERFLGTSGDVAMSIHRYLMCPLASQALLQAPSVAALKKSWQILVIVEGSLLWSPMHEVAGIVMMSWPHSVLLWKGSPKKVGVGELVHSDKPRCALGGFGQRSHKIGFAAMGRLLRGLCGGFALCPSLWRPPSDLTSERFPSALSGVGLGHLRRSYPMLSVGMSGVARSQHFAGEGSDCASRWRGFALRDAWRSHRPSQLDQLTSCATLRGVVLQDPAIGRGFARFRASLSGNV